MIDARPELAVAPEGAFVLDRYYRPVRKLLAWLLVTLGIAALIRRLRRRGEQVEPASVATAGDPAEDLRRKLADARPAATAPEEPSSTPMSPEAAVEERRAEVHEEGRSTIDEMRRPPAEE